MPEPQPESLNNERGRFQFNTTHWSVVLAAGDSANPTAHSALEQLCRVYWFPLYAFVRRRGLDSHTAQDVVQGFFAQLLQRQAFNNSTPDQGRFRSFLLASLQYYLADLADHQNAAKRGGGHVPIALDALEAEERYSLEPVDRLSPEKIFERRWALTVLEEVMTRLRAEFLQKDKPELFHRLQEFLQGEKSHGTYADVAAEFGLSESAIKMAVSRLRQRYRQLFRAIIAETVSDPSEIEAELRHLFALMGG